jgi:IPT/TIG domain/RHS Repeat
VGGTITINGSGFGAFQNGAVLINGINAGIQYTCPQNPWYGECWSDTQIQAVIPNTTSGTVTVSNDGIVSNAMPFTITNPPVITSVSPTTGEPATVITINGSNFGATQSNSSVAVDGLPAPVNSWSDGQIVAFVPDIPMNGPVSVTVAGITAQGPLFIYNAINQLTASNGALTTYSSSNSGGGWRLYSSSGPGCSSCSARGNVLNSSDANGNLLSTTDANGNTVTYTLNGLVLAVPSKSGSRCRSR